MSKEHAPTRLSAEARRQAILEVAIPRFARLGLYGASTLEIAAAAGISEAYLFRLFGTKRALFLAALAEVCQRILSTLRAAVEQAPPESHHAALHAAWFQMKPPREDLWLIQQAFAAAHDPEVQATTRQQMQNLIDYLVEVGESQEAIQRLLGDGLLATIAITLDLPFRIT